MIFNAVKDYEKYQFNLQVRIGETLNTITSNVAGYEKRDCYKLLSSFYHNSFPNKVLALYGLRRTGKTTLIFQSIRDLGYKKCAYIKARTTDNMSLLLKDLDELVKEGYQYIFIDEVTLLKDFIDTAATLSDIYSNLNIKIVLSGTDSLGFYFASLNELYDRVILVHTSYIPFREFVRLLNTQNIDDYIAYGGTLKRPNMNFDDEDYKNEELSFLNDESTRKYINTSIAKNIFHSLKNDTIGNRYNKLKDLYDENELVNVINRIINNYNHLFLVRIIDSIFKSNDLQAGKSLLLHGEDDIKDVLYNIDEKEVLKRMKEILEIKEKDERNIEITPLHLEQLKNYLYKLDLIDEIDVEYENGESEKRTIFTQPGMRFSLVEALIFSLTKDPYINSLSFDARNNVVIKLIENVKGIMLEDITLLETQRKFKDKLVFKYISFNDGEYDMVIYDKEKNECHLYEIKHSAATVFEHQTKYLRNEILLDKISKRYGHVASRNVLFRGLTEVINDINFINIEDYLAYL